LARQTKAAHHELPHQEQVLLLTAVLPLLRVQLVLKGLKASKVQPDLQALQELQVQLALPVQQELLALRDQQALMVQTELTEPLAQQDRKAHKALPDPKVLKVIQV
tara:strand:- start:207 stop:524 length:318 start_codon:yes stop_codon:yes gene_type:complete